MVICEGEVTDGLVLFTTILYVSCPHFCKLSRDCFNLSRILFAVGDKNVTG